MILLVVKEDNTISIFDTDNESFIEGLRNSYTVLPEGTKTPNTPQFTWRWNSESDYIYTDMNVYNRAKWEDIRAKRDILLSKSDILVTRAVESGTDVNPIRQYRQALRDITNQSDPFNIVWPSLPDSELYPKDT